MTFRQVLLRSFLRNGFWFAVLAVYLSGRALGEWLKWR